MSAIPLLLSLNAKTLQFLALREDKNRDHGDRNRGRYRDDCAQIPKQAGDSYGYNRVH